MEIIPTFNQVVNSKNPKCKLYPEYKKVVDFTHFLKDSATFKERWWYYENKLPSPVLCLCGCEKSIKTPWKTKFLQGHSNKSDVVKQNKKNALMEKYGVDNVSKLDEVKNKKKETTFKSIGVTSPFDRKYMEPIWMEKFGVNNPSKIPEVVDKIQKWHKENSKYTTQYRNERFMDKFYDKLINEDRDLGDFKILCKKEDYKGVFEIYDFECQKCKNITKSNLDAGKIPRCFTCYPKIESGGQSLIEKELIDYCKTFNYNIIEQSRDIIPPLELDIFIPELSLAIELNGLYYHSEKMGKHKFYHKFKTEACEKNNIRLIHIFEDEWNDKNKLCKNRIKHIMNKNNKKSIYARKCEVREIPSDVKAKFLRKYHIQGNDTSKIHLGLFFKNRMVAVMTFSNMRRALGYKNSNTDDYELVRYCSIFNFSIVGGAGKLLSYFEKTYKPTNLTSYADRRWSDGNLYKKLNFEFKGFTLPNYWYTKNDNRFHRFAFQKHLLVEKLESYNPDISEVDNMKANGYYRIWDCGHYKFVKKYIWE